MASLLPRSTGRVPVLASLGAGLLGVALGVWTENWLSALLIALSVLLAVLVTLLIRVLIQRERQDRLLLGLDAGRPGAPSVSVPAARPLYPAVSLEERFRDALSEMREHFGREGVYELPWFLVIGDVSAGKSVFLQECGLDVPARYARRGFGPTESCEFVLANEAVALDTPGRWFRCASEAERGEWRKLLELLRRHRGECPINGVIVALSVPVLLSQNGPELEEHGRELRRRLNELRVDLGLDAPVYLVLTKADALEGFVDTIRPLPAAWRQQAVGWTNDQRRIADPEKLVERELRALVERLEGFLPELMLRDSDPLRQLRIFAYPQELGALARAVATVAGTAFKRDAYDAEAPFLRGIYLASARVEGSAMSPTLARLGVHAAIGRRGDTPLRGLFLRDVMLEIAQGDENLAVRDSRIGPKGRRAIGAATAVVALWVLILWGISFAQNYNGIRGLALWSERAMLPDPPLADLADFQARLAVEEKNASSPIQWVGFHRIASGVESGRRTFTWSFLRSFDTITRANMVRALDGDDQAAVLAAITIATDLNFLARRGSGAGAPTLDPYLPQFVKDPKLYARLYEHFVRWLPERERQELIRGQQAALIGPIAKLLQLPVLERITSDPQGSFPPVRYTDFDPDRTAQTPTRAVAGIYTRAGQEKLIQVLLEAVESAPDAVAPTAVADFKRQYAELYRSTWRDFLRDAPVRPRARADVKGTSYLALLEAIDSNTQTLPSGESDPEWVKMLRAIRKDSETPFEKLPIPGRDEALKKLGPPWAAYLKALEAVQLEVDRAVQASEQALAVARDVAEGKESPFSKAIQKVEEIVNLVLATSTDAEIKAKLGQILQAPILDGYSEVLRLAMPELQRSWQLKIVSRFPSEDAPGAIKEFRGEAAQYVEQDLGPFWRDVKPRPLLGRREIPIGPGAKAWIQSVLSAPIGAGTGFGALVVSPLPAANDPGKAVVTRAQLIFSCPSSKPQLDYRMGGAEKKSLSWEEGCVEVILRATVVDARGATKEIEHTHWNGSRALQLFLAAGTKQSDRIREWRINQDGVDVGLRFTIHEQPRVGPGLARPPASIGS